MAEFQPSGLQKESYLNVAAHWLWSRAGHISFDLGCSAEWGSRVAGFEAYVSDDQFQPAAQSLAALAAQQVQQLAHSVPSMATAADLLIRRESDLPPPSRGSWTAYHAGVAAGLADRPHDAETMLCSVSDDRVKDAAGPFIDALPDTARFNAVAFSLVARQREALRLPEVSPLGL